MDSTAAKKGEEPDATKIEKCIQNFVGKCAKAEGQEDCTPAVNSCFGLAMEAWTCGERTVGCQDGDGLSPAGCGSGTDDDCTSCFADLGLTVQDTCQSLEWEKKDTAVGSGADTCNLDPGGGSPLGCSRRNSPARAALTPPLRSQSQGIVVTVLVVVVVVVVSGVRSTEKIR